MNISGARELLSLEALAALLQQALFALALADLHQVVLPPTPSLIGVDGNLVPVPADFRPRAGPQRHDCLLLGYKTSDDNGVRPIRLTQPSALCVSSREDFEWQSPLQRSISRSLLCLPYRVSGTMENFNFTP